MSRHIHLLDGLDGIDWKHICYKPWKAALYLGKINSAFPIIHTNLILLAKRVDTRPNGFQKDRIIHNAVSFSFVGFDALGGSPDKIYEYDFLAL